MNEIFNLCVQLLNWSANLLGVTYRQINVLYFVFINPAIIIFLIIRLRLYKYLYKQLKEYTHYSDEDVPG